jgi:flagellar protein FlaG
VVKVVDQTTKEVLRQIPTPEALEIAKALESKSSTGLLIQQTA